MCNIIELANNLRIIDVGILTVSGAVGVFINYLVASVKYNFSRYYITNRDKIRQNILAMLLVVTVATSITVRHSSIESDNLIILILVGYIVGGILRKPVHNE